MQDKGEKVLLEYIIDSFKDVPDEEWLNNLSTLDVYKDNNPIDENIKGIVDEINTLGIKNAAANYNEEYVQLFTHPTSFSTLPIASYHLSRENVLVSDITLELKEIYANYHYKVQTPYSEDHLIPLLLFLEKINLKQRNEFIEKYIVSWVPAFAENVINNTSFKYFANTANLLQILCDIYNEEVPV